MDYATRNCNCSDCRQLRLRGLLGVPGPMSITQAAKRIGSRPGAETFEISHWGYVESFEAVLLDPIPHMDTSEQMSIVISAHINGRPFGGWTVHSLHRSIVS